MINPVDCSCSGRSTGFVGLRHNSDKGTWQAVVRVAKGKRTILGTFATAEEAARVHDSAAYHLHGRYVWIGGLQCVDWWIGLQSRHKVNEILLYFFTTEIVPLLMQHLICPSPCFAALLRSTLRMRSLHPRMRTSYSAWEGNSQSAAEAGRGSRWTDSGESLKGREESVEERPAMSQELTRMVEDRTVKMAAMVRVMGTLREGDGLRTSITDTCAFIWGATRPGRRRPGIGTGLPTTCMEGMEGMGLAPHYIQLLQY